MVAPRLVGADFCVAWETNRYSVPPRFASKSAMVRVLDGRIDILIDGAIVAAHALRADEVPALVAPEHEAEFRTTCTSRHVLKDQFQRLGAIAEPFATGLVEQHGGSAGYHMGQILKLADKVGAARVVEALRRAARYGAFDHNAVARIVAGKPAKATARRAREQGRLTDADSSQYLKGTGVHQRSPDGYKKLVGKRNTSPSTDDKKKSKKEDKGDGE